MIKFKIIDIIRVSCSSSMIAESGNIYRWLDFVIRIDLDTISQEAKDIHSSPGSYSIDTIVLPVYRNIHTGRRRRAEINKSISLLPEHPVIEPIENEEIEMHSFVEGYEFAKISVAQFSIKNHNISDAHDVEIYEGYSYIKINSSNINDVLICLEIDPYKFVEHQDDYIYKRLYIFSNYPSEKQIIKAIYRNKFLSPEAEYEIMNNEYENDLYRTEDKLNRDRFSDIENDFRAECGGQDPWSDNDW